MSVTYQVPKKGRCSVRQFRQGDVFLVEVDIIPPEADQLGGRVILAEGEVTGHAHEVKRYARLFRTEMGDRYLQVIRSTLLEHQEHGQIELPKGNYRLVIQREYDPISVRSVVD